jgi:hypothetical protein
MVTLRVPPTREGEVGAFIERFAWKGHVTRV